MGLGEAERKGKGSAWENGVLGWGSRLGLGLILGHL